MLAEANPAFDVLKLSGLDPEAKYEVSSERVQGKVYYGDELMNSGLMFNEHYMGTSMSGGGQELNPLDSFVGDFKSSIITLNRVD